MLDKKENSEDQQVFQADAGKLNNKGDLDTKVPPKRSTAGINKHLSKDHGGKFLSLSPS